MSEATLQFPAGFRWGVATSAHQVEGDNQNNDWWLWEQGTGHIKDGRRSAQACRWWEDAEADLDRAAEVGVNALRLSVEWSRVEPRQGEFDAGALARYRQILEGVRDRGMEPMVTLHHFANPIWLVEQGGWERPEAVGRFARFVRQVVHSLGDLCDLWCTINEPNIYAVQGYLEGVWPPGVTNLGLTMRVLRHQLLGHAAAYREIHGLQSAARVGFAHNMRLLDAANPRSLLDRWVAWMVDWGFNQALLHALTRGRWVLPLGVGDAAALRGTLDWIGLDYYTRDRITFDVSKPQELFARRLHSPDAELLDGGYGEFYPQGMGRCLERLAELGVPIYVTENGVPDDDDDQRPRHLLAHLEEVWRAIQQGCPVRGYFHWTLVDNFEWAEGWSLRFGLIELDPDTQLRRPRPSAELYAQIARSNCITPQVVEAYAPALRKTWGNRV